MTHPKEEAGEPVAWTDAFELAALEHSDGEGSALMFRKDVAAQIAQGDLIPLFAAPPAPPGHIAAADTEMREALKKAEAALLPLSNAVYNDNGDMTISVPLLSSDQCVTAYFAVMAIRAALNGGKHG